MIESAQLLEYTRPIKRTGRVMLFGVVFDNQSALEHTTCLVKGDAGAPKERE